MVDPISANTEDALAVALAAFSLSVNTLRFLRQEGALDQNGVSAIVGGVLSALEKNERISEPVAHSARTLLSGVAADLGVRLSAPH